MSFRSAPGAVAEPAIIDIKVKIPSADGLCLPCNVLLYQTLFKARKRRPYREIAAELTSRAIVSPRGGVWNAMTVMRMMNRLGIANPTQPA
jgi:hypothetical protein